MGLKKVVIFLVDVLKVLKINEIEMLLGGCETAFWVCAVAVCCICGTVSVVAAIKTAGGAAACGLRHCFFAPCRRRGLGIMQGGSSSRDPVQSEAGRGSHHKHADCDDNGTVEESSS